MSDNFVTNNVARKLKTIGFNEPCMAWYDNDGVINVSSYETKKPHEMVLAPTYTELFEWLKVNFKIMVHPYFKVNPFGEDFIPPEWEHIAHYRKDNQWHQISGTNKHLVISEVLRLIDENKLL